MYVNAKFASKKKSGFAHKAPEKCHTRNGLDMWVVPGTRFEIGGWLPSDSFDQWFDQ